jgi:hypothetical protein
MKFHEFLHSTYTSANQDLQKVYSVYAHGKTQASQELLSAQRSVCKFFSYFHILGHYLLVKLHVVVPPKSPEQQIREALEASESKAKVESEPITAKVEEVAHV